MLSSCKLRILRGELAMGRSLGFFFYRELRTTRKLRVQVGFWSIESLGSAASWFGSQLTKRYAY